MGWSLRKSIKLGPARLNLSSRGIGYSVGVRGFRVGTRRGRSYVRAGRGMLRYQAALGGSAAAGSTSVSADAATGLGQGCLAVAVAGGLLLAALVVLGWLSQASVEALRWTVVVASIVAVAAFAAMTYTLIKSWRERRSLKAFVEAADALLTNPQPTNADAEEVVRLREAVVSVPEKTTEALQAAYRQAVAEAVTDQRVTPEEQSRLTELARGLGLSDEVVRQAQVGGFLEGFACLVGDGKLTESEEEKLQNLRQAFDIPEDLIRAQLAKADQLKRARQVEQFEALTPIEITIKLKKGEACFYAAPVTEKKYRVVHSQVIGGERFTERDLEDVRSGDLYLTSERLLLVSEGTTSIKLEKVIDVSLEPQRQGEIVSIVVDGRKTPYYFETREAFILVAYLARLTAS